MSPKQQVRKMGKNKSVGFCKPDLKQMEKVNFAY
jgi:hypothetical protein